MIDNSITNTNNKINKAIVLYALNNFISLPPLADFETSFPYYEIKYNREYYTLLALALVERLDYGSLHKERTNMDLPKHLFDEKEIMLLHCSIITGVLRDWLFRRVT